MVHLKPPPDTSVAQLLTASIDRNCARKQKSDRFDAAAFSITPRKSLIYLEFCLVV